MDMLLLGLGLAFVLEGLLPFMFPNLMKRVYARLSLEPEAQLRIFGFIAIVSGLSLLYLIR